MRLLLWLSILATNSCATHRPAVPSPKGKLCTHEANLQIAFCSDISGGNALPPVPIVDTDKWIMFDLITYKSLMDYIDALRAN